MSLHWKIVSRFPQGNFSPRRGRVSHYYRIQIIKTFSNHFFKRFRFTLFSIICQWLKYKNKFFLRVLFRTVKWNDGLELMRNQRYTKQVAPVQRRYCVASPCRLRDPSDMTHFIVLLATIMKPIVGSSLCLYILSSLSD